MGWERGGAPQRLKGLGLPGRGVGLGGGGVEGGAEGGGFLEGNSGRTQKCINRRTHQQPYCVPSKSSWKIRRGKTGNMKPCPRRNKKKTWNSGICRGYNQPHHLQYEKLKNSAWRGIWPTQKGGGGGRDLLERGGGGGEGVQGRGGGGSRGEGSPPVGTYLVHREQKIYWATNHSAHGNVILLVANKANSSLQVNSGIPHLIKTQQIQLSGTFTISCQLTVIMVNQN